ncbi:DUF6445 family protein [Xenorhabdus bovienii]|uniref:DUF6445 family protein n=1 Tax=Xenorhabdus bovienii TaxID=40576 RepID=UPI0023B2823C|nr:DUF6445 family protein [Xenorhabdus bovienii]MDE9536973.1 DUF6445 family protein [Xenorhabdus bovienii]MDE9589972.1 DUF6445 family protein [Xenorhabdus bovienii]
MQVNILLELNSIKDMSIQVKRIGNDNIPIMIVDNFLKYPEEVRKFALSLNYDKPLLGDYWPGIQAAASLNRKKIEEFITHHYIEPILGLDCSNYHFPAVLPNMKADQWSSWFLQTRFGAITRPFDEAPWTKNPHVDYFGFLASVLYLSLPDQSRGGTVFIRHRQTGIETIPPAVSGLPKRLCQILRETRSYEIIYGKIYEELRAGHSESWEHDNVINTREDQVITEKGFDAVWKTIMNENIPTSGYLTESNQVWEITDQVDVAFNRLVLHPTWHLHSVSWDPSWFGETLPERRLTMMNWVNFPVENVKQ